MRRSFTVMGWLGIGLVPLAVTALTLGARPTATIAAAARLGPGTTVAARAVAGIPPEPASVPLSGFALELIADGFDAPVDVAAAPGSDDLFVVEKTGRIVVVTGGEVLEEPFLDLSAKIDTFAERGLLDLAFHPDYEENGRLFVHYTDREGNTRIVEYRRAADAHLADELTASVILAVDQPHFYHNGGRLQIGPDGYLWVGLGDGGGIDDRFGNGQRPDTVLGALLRIDVDSARPYAIPPDNPFAHGGGAPAVWAYGLRNPWRFWVDAASQQVYIADVGQDLWEEINVVSMRAGGANFGWPVWEADTCLSADECDGDFTAPVFAYAHDRTCAIIGGPVYRGSAIPELWGHLIYADYCAGWIRSIEVRDGAVTATADVSPGIGRQLTSFGVDRYGEILVIADDGLYRLVADRAD